MEYATLGNTGLLVSKLCFGTMTFGDGRGIFKGISAVGQGGADELVKTSIHGGIKFLDTADNYTEGVRKVSRAIAEKSQHRAEGCRDRDEDL